MSIPKYFYLSLLLSFAISQFASADYCPTPSTAFQGTISSSVKYDSKTKTYTYSYTIKNDLGSLVPIEGLFLFLSEKPTTIEQHANWDSTFYGADSSPARLIWSTFYATGKFDPSRPEAGQRRVPDSAVKPGKSLSGFSFKSPNPPGSIQYFPDGFTQLPMSVATADNDDPDLNCPNIDQENPQFRGMATGITTGPMDPSVLPLKLRLRKPGGRERCGEINSKSPPEKISLLVIGTKEMDVGKIDISSLRFGPDEAAPISSKIVGSDFHSGNDHEMQEEWESHSERLKGKRNLSNKNLLLTFNVKDLGVQCNLDHALFLKGNMQNLENIFGGVTTKWVGCDIKHPGKRKVLSPKSKD